MTGKTTKTMKLIQDTLKDERPNTVKRLVHLVQKKTSLEKTEIYDAIQQMEKEKKIHLGATRIERKLPSTLRNFFLRFHYYSVEFWVILSFTLIFFLLVLLVQKGSPVTFLRTMIDFPIVLLVQKGPFVTFLRTMIGLLYCLFIPGWTFANLLFPKLYETIDQFERMLLALGINIGIVIFTGISLDTYWVIDDYSFIISIGVVTIVLLFISSTLRILIGSGKLETFFNKVILKRGEKE